MGFKLVSAVLVVALALSGPLAPLAWAQEKTEGQIAPTKEGQDGVWVFATGVTNAIFVPGKAILCGVGAVTGVVVLLVTFGSGYQSAAGVWQEGCGGRWTVSVSDLRPDEGESPYLTERYGYKKEDFQRTE